MSATVEMTSYIMIPMTTNKLFNSLSNFFCYRFQFGIYCNSYFLKDRNVPVSPTLVQGRLIFMSLHCRLRCGDFELMRENAPYLHENLSGHREVPSP